MEVTTYTLLKVLITLASGYLLIRFWRRRSLKHPPGPWILPIVGSLPFLHLKEPTLFQTLMRQLRSEYGNIVRFALGKGKYIIVSGYSEIREALIDKGVEFAGRPRAFPRTKYFFLGQPECNWGIIDTTYSDEWKNQRNVSMVILRELGYGKRSMEVRISEEAGRLTRALLEQDGKSIDPEPLLRKAVSCVICQVALGEGYSYDSPEFEKLLNWVGEVLAYFYKDIEPDLIPILRIKPSYGRLMKKIKELAEFVPEFFGAKIEQHRSTLFVENIRDFIDGYLVAQQFGKKKKVPTATLR